MRNLPIIASIFATTLVVCSLSTVSQASTVGNQTSPFVNFKIDLNKAPRDRFREQATFFKDEISLFVADYSPHLPEYAYEAFYYLGWIIQLL
jgi:hypothetical protein